MDTSMNPSTSTPQTATPSHNGAAGHATDTSLVDRAAQTAHDAIDRLAAKAGPAMERMRSAASSASETFKGKAQALGEMEEQWVENSREYVRANPLTAVAIGVVAGMLLSRLLQKD